MEDDWEGAFEDDRVQKRPIDEHVQLLLTFAQEHDTILQTILSATSVSIAETSDAHFRSLRVAIDTNERVFPQDILLFGSQLSGKQQRQSIAFNENLHKILMVIIFLSDEMKELKEIAETKFYDPLVMFGSHPNELSLASSVLSPSDQESRQRSHESNLINAGVREKMIGKLLPLLQELSNFVDRCFAVVVNVIQQLSSLLSPGNKEGKNIFRAGQPIGTSSGTTQRPFHILFQGLGEILTVLITFDLIVRQNEILRESWLMYKTMVSSFVRNDPATFSTNEESVLKYERMLVSIDQTIMTAQMFKCCIEQQFESTIQDQREVFIKVRGNQLFFSEMLNCFKFLLETSMTALGTNTEVTHDRQQIVSSLALYALFRRLLPANISPDLKLHKILWGVQKTVPMVILSRRLMWATGEFLNSYVPVVDAKKLDPPVPAAFRRQFVQLFDAGFSSKVATIVAQVEAWLVIAETKLQASLRHESDDIGLPNSMDMRGSIILKGLAIANRVSHLANAFLTMHASMQIPLNKTFLREIGQLVEYLKAMEFTFLRKDLIVHETIMGLTRILAHSLVGLLKPIFARVATSSAAQAAASSYSGRRTVIGAAGALGRGSTVGADPLQFDFVYTGEMLDNLLRTSESYSNSRISALVVLSEIVSCSAYVNEKESTRIRSLARRVVQLTGMPKQLREACDTSFLFFHLDLLSPLVMSIFSSSTEANRLQYLLSAFSDGVRLCDAVIHLPEEVKASYLTHYRLYLKSHITKHIIDPLCAEIETDLRLHVHTKHLDHMEGINPKTENLRPLRCFLDLAPLRLLGHSFDLKREVTHYLDMNFYNLTTIALHDWRMYSEMRSVAMEKYDIHLINNFLPMGSLDQGLDVLQIMRNIHIFVSRFTYNMNMQQFVEYRPDKNSKHLNTIKIQSIAASIRQHGLGVLNTTVNYTYQFLITKFNIFNQFLQDDYIRAHLSREHRWFKKHRNDPEVNNCYPYDRALKFVRDIRKLGLSSENNNKSFLDLFRVTITEIGNALGYVRMVRSASMYYCSEAVKYLPELDNIISFKDHAGSSSSSSSDVDQAQGANFSEETVRAAANLDDVINTLIKNFGEGSDYFKVLVNVFQTVLQTDDNEHLKSFYIIVPALAISWIEASLQAKDAMYKTSQTTRGGSREMYYTDDGFAMGITYCLAILKQTRKYEALHWVDTVRQKTKQETKILKDQQEARAAKEAKIKEQQEKNSRGVFSFLKSKKPTESDPNYDEDYADMEEVHALQTTAKRLEAQRRETEQLFYSLSGASIFFKRTDNDI